MKDSVTREVALPFYLNINVVRRTASLNGSNGKRSERRRMHFWDQPTPPLAD